MGTFLLFMQPIHLVIGVIEGLITGIIVTYLSSQNNHLIYHKWEPSEPVGLKKILLTLLATTIIIGGVLSLLASTNPDGLEWSLNQSSTVTEVSNPSAINTFFENVQEKIALLPGYDFNKSEASNKVGTSTSGILGSVLTLLVTFLIGMIIRFRRRKKGDNESTH
jgi:cobalt/nickel transport system permease protein